MACMPPWKRLRWILIPSWLGASAMGATCSAAAWLPASRDLWVTSLVEVLSVCGKLGLMYLALISFSLGLVCGIKALVDRRMGPLTLLLPVALPLVLLCGIYVLEQRFPTPAAAARTAQCDALEAELKPTMAPVISAIDKFEAENRRLPDSLSEAKVGDIDTQYGRLEYVRVTKRGGYLLTVGEYQHGPGQFGYDSYTGWYWDR
jgi:hypothetical protein